MSRNARRLLLGLAAGGPSGPSGPSGPVNLPPGSSFDDSVTVQNVDSAVVYPGGGAEWASFGDVKEMDGVTAWTKVWRLRWGGSTQQQFAGRWDGPGGKWQWDVRWNSSQGEVEVFISQTGSDYAALKTNFAAEAGNLLTLALAFDGSRGGTNGVERLRMLRDIGAGFVQIGWSAQFFSGRSDVPTVMNTPAALEERQGNVVAGSGSTWNGEVHNHASVMGRRMSAAELDAFPWDDEAAWTVAQRNEWDRLYFYNGNLGDENNQVHGVFATP